MGDTMSDNERNEIIYEEGWRDADPPAADGLPLDEVPAPAELNKPSSMPLLISIQLGVCILAAAALFILRAMDSPAYRGFMTWYKVEMNKTLISRDFFEQADLSRLASRDEVKVKASPDELPHR